MQALLRCIENHSRWKFAFQEASSLGNSTIFLFTLSLRDGSTCRPVSYRPGDCCNQAMDAVSLAIVPAFRDLIRYVKVYTYDGKELVVQTVEDAFGLRMVLPKELYVQDIPDGEFYTFELGFAASDYADTTKLPCRASKFEPSLPSCDYWIHGWQTDPDDSSKVITPSERVAGCCPEGVVQFCSEQISGTCNPRLSDSPYRLSFVSTQQFTGQRTTTVTFQVTQQAVTNPLFNTTVPALPDCSSMSLQSVKLFVSADAAARVAQVAFNGVTAAYTVGKDATGNFISAAVPGSRTGVGSWVVTLSERFEKEQVCSLKVGQFSVCNYVFNGQSGLCCSMGDVAVTETQLPRIQFG